MSERPGRTRIKICGLCRLQDLEAAVSIGVDAIGLVFCPASPRHLEPQQARELVRSVPAFVSVVALFLDPDAGLVDAVLDQVKPEILQFHGREPAGFCRGFGRRYMKAISMGNGARPAEDQMAEHASACGFVLDSHSPGGMGGTGLGFDWSRVPAQGGERLVLAGGLHPGNVGEAIRAARPHAVDVSSGVESAPGIKSAAKMADFVRAVSAADASTG